MENLPLHIAYSVAKNSLTSPEPPGITKALRRRPMAWPRMLRIRQTFPRSRVADIPRTVAQALGAAGLPIKGGDAVAVGAGSRGIGNIDGIVGAAVRWLRDLGARPFVFPAMGSPGGGTPQGRLAVLAHYGLPAATKGCPLPPT